MVEPLGVPDLPTAVACTARGAAQANSTGPTGAKD